MVHSPSPWPPLFRSFLENKSCEQNSSPLLSCPGFGKLDLTLRMNRALSKMAAITQTSRTGIWHLFTFLRYLDAWCWCQSSMSVWQRPMKCKFCCARMWTLNKWFYWPQIPWIGVKFDYLMDLGPERSILGERQEEGQKPASENQAWYKKSKWTPRFLRLSSLKRVP